MKKINLSITGCLGRMGKQLIKSSKRSRDFKIVSITENRKINKRISGLRPSLNSKDAFKKTKVIIDFTVPKCTLEVLKIASKLKTRVVIGTTGFSKKEEILIKKYSKIASRSLGNKFLSKIHETHHKHKKDHPSGTALMLGKGIAVGKNIDLSKNMGTKYFNKKTFPYSKKINFNSRRKGKVVGEHEVKFSSGKEVITLNHEAFDRALYSEGALTAAKWLMNKKPGLYSMKNVLNFN